MNLKIDLSYLNKENVVILLSNLLIVVGMIIFKWSPLSVFALYMLETIIIGLLHGLKMLFIGTASNEIGSTAKLFFSIPFFLLHFMFFVFIQASLVMPQEVASFFGGFGRLFSFVHGEYLIFLIVIATFNMYILIKDLFFNDRYKNVSLDKVFFEPYPRIFIQQFTVILGAGLMMFTGSYWGLLIVFIIAKTTAEILISQRLHNEQLKKIG